MRRVDPLETSPEFLILVDENDREIGTVEKLSAHRQGLLHRAFSIIIWDSTGRQLLQKRHADKYHSGGLWTNACCGHPRPGEAIADAARRRLAEEMGIECPLAPLGTIIYRAEFQNGLTEHEIVHVFRGLFDGTIAPDPKEAEGTQWCLIEDIRHDIAATPERFSVWFRRYVAEEWPLAFIEPSATVDLL